MQQSIQYFSGNVQIAWGGVDFTGGLAPNAFIAYKRAVDITSTVVGSDNSRVRSKMADTSGTLTLQFLHGTIESRILAEIINQQDLGLLGTNGIVSANFSVVDPSGHSIARVFRDCVIQTAPPIDFSNSADGTVVPWVFNVGELLYSGFDIDTALANAGIDATIQSAVESIVSNI